MQNAIKISATAPPRMFYAPDFLAPLPAKRLQRRMALNPQKGADMTVPPRFEELLVRVGAHQDEEAFAQLFNHFAPRLKSYLLKHGAPEATAEEIVQNTFVTVWEKAGSYNPQKAAASTWIFTIARNKRIDALRREKFVEINTDDPSLENAAADNTEEYADAATLEKLGHALGDLPPEQAKLLRMAYFEDKSHQAIADETHLPLGTVKSRLRLALDKMKHKLRGEKP